MAGFITAGTVMYNTAQSGAIWSSLLYPQQSQPASADLTKLGWVSLGHFLCAVNFGDLVDLCTMTNRPSTQWPHALPGGRLHLKQPAAEIAITLSASLHSSKPSHI